MSTSGFGISYNITQPILASLARNGAVPVHISYENKLQLLNVFEGAHKKRLISAPRHGKCSHLTTKCRVVDTVQTRQSRTTLDPKPPVSAPIFLPSTSIFLFQSDLSASEIEGTVSEPNKRRACLPSLLHPALAVHLLFQLPLRLCPYFPSKRTRGMLTSQ